MLKRNIIKENEKEVQNAMDNNCDLVYRLEPGCFIVLGLGQNSKWPGWLRFTAWALAGLGGAILSTWLAGGI